MDRVALAATLASAARVLAAAGQEYVTEVGYPEPDRGPLQVLRSPEPAPEPEPAGSPA